jgi:ABC-2 type transport system ATP-binding protein
VLSTDIKPQPLFLIKDNILIKSKAVHWRIMTSLKPSVPLIAVQDIKKQYKDLWAVNGVNLNIEKGCCFGLLGPNGAGKTTLIEIIEDIIPPNEGTILYKGEQRSARFRQEIGIMFQQTALLSFMTIEETLKTFSRLYDKTTNISELIHICHLEEVKKRQNDKISGGQKQRLLLALALLNQPELIFLDEPSTGLDPQSRQNLWDILRDVKTLGKTIILTTHYMEEAERLCDDIAIMDRGKIIARGSPSQLIQTHCRKATLSIPKALFPDNIDDLRGKKLERDGTVDIRTMEVNIVIEQLIAAGVNMSGVNVKTPTLEDVFLKLTGRSLRE